MKKGTKKAGRPIPKISEVLANEKTCVVEKRMNLGNVVVIQAYYPDVPEESARKIMVFEKATPLMSFGRIRHDFESSSSPCAKFNPDQNGWDNAVAFAYVLSGRRAY